MNFQIYFRHVMHLWCEHFCLVFLKQLTSMKVQTFFLYQLSQFTTATQTGLLKQVC